MKSKSNKAAAFFAEKGEKWLAAHEKREAAGKEKDTPAIATKEENVMKIKKAPAKLRRYEKAEHKEMGFAKGSRVRGDGCITKGRSRGKIV